MLYSLISPSMDPFFNLALEEHLFTARRDKEFFMLWRNGPSVIIGRHQDASLETDEAWLAEKGVPVIRRISGGGAVYHDEGNINCSFICDGTPGTLDFAAVSSPLLGALRAFGIEAELSGRKDIICGGKKISGSAQHCRKGRALHHATLLYDADLDALRRALAVKTPFPADEKCRAVRSVPSSVANIRTIMARPFPLEDFIAALYTTIVGLTGARDYCLSPADMAGAQALKASRYQTRAWNVEASPLFRESRKAA